MDDKLVENVAKALFNNGVKHGYRKAEEWNDAIIRSGYCDDAEIAIMAHNSYKHSLPGILKIQGDANILLDGINSIELFDDEIRYDGKTIYRGKYKRGEERDIIAKYTEAQRNKHSDDRDPDDIVRECDMRIEEAYKRKEQIMAEACGITTKTRETDG